MTLTSSPPGGPPHTAKVLTISALGLLISRPSTYAKDNLQTVSFSFGSSSSSARRWRARARSHRQTQNKDIEGQFNAHPSTRPSGTNYALKASESQGSLLSRRRESDNGAPTTTTTTTTTTETEWGPNDMQPVVPDRQGRSGDSGAPSPPERAMVRAAGAAGLGGGSWRVEGSWKLVSLSVKEIPGERRG
jgi:hypothetical protein